MLSMFPAIACLHASAVASQPRSSPAHVPHACQRPLLRLAPPRLSLQTEEETKQLFSLPRRKPKPEITASDDSSSNLAVAGGALAS